jgi:hypothetical protein
MKKTLFIAAANAMAAVLITTACSKTDSVTTSREPPGGSGQKNASPFQPYKDPKQRFEIREVAVATEPVDAKSTIEKLPNKLRPSDPANSRTVVLVLTLASENDNLNEIKSSEFSLVYGFNGRESESQCVGLSMGDSDMWGLAETGETSMFVKAKPPQKQKLLFLLPSGVTEATLRHQGAGGAANVKQNIPLGGG